MSELDAPLPAVIVSLPVDLEGSVSWLNQMRINSMFLKFFVENGFGCYHIVIVVVNGIGKFQRNWILLNEFIQ